MERTPEFAAVLSKRALAAGDTTHYAIAERAGVRESTISRLLAGRTAPSLSTLIAVADAYGMTLDELVGRTTHAPGVPQQGAQPARAEAAA
ncbi:helix-turn-helix domain-containing protein [Streptomyces sp. NPDC053560]|uniref:helix-turn-helix domain-containing protein n=1 Tax=Streptomyces sp. NPDC053560 TaxID=3365711 RepID=UPI0037D719E2